MKWRISFSGPPAMAGCLVNILKSELVAAFCTPTIENVTGTRNGAASSAIRRRWRRRSIGGRWLRSMSAPGPDVAFGVRRLNTAGLYLRCPDVTRATVVPRSQCWAGGVRFSRNQHVVRYPSGTGTKGG